MSRTDVDPEVDVPSLGFPNDENVRSESWTVEHSGKRLVVVQGELWRNEWVEPAQHSYRIRGDKRKPAIFFVTDAEGTRESGEALKEVGIDGRGWLWFRAEVIIALAERRGGGLKWYTRDTGAVWCSPDFDVHFGVNRIGLVNVYAKDVGLLPEWQQRIWAGHNAGPEGGVSDELLAPQVQAKPADTQAPEAYLATGLAILKQRSIDVFGVSVVRDHQQIPEIVSRCHRFRVIDRSGLFGLAKDLARVTADSIDASTIHKLLSIPKKNGPGSLKSLEQLVAKTAGAGVARRMLGPFFGIYELRHGDAHLPSEQFDEAFRLVGIDEISPFINQGFQLLDACVTSIYEIAGQIREITDQRASQ